MTRCLDSEQERSPRDADRCLRHGLLFLVTLEEQGPTRLEALPLALDYCHARTAAGEEAAWIRRRVRNACARLGSDVREEGDLLVVDWDPVAASVSSG